jgi:dynein heavy chain
MESIPEHKKSFQSGQPPPEEHFPEGEEEGEMMPIEEEEKGEEDEQIVNYREILNALYQDSSKAKGHTIQDSLFIDAEVKKHLRKIQTGEDAISFFAKYGNTTPIKSIICVLAKTAPELFRPYDLIVLNMENITELNLSEYYTISAHGIVHVHTNKMRRKSKSM